MSSTTSTPVPKSAPVLLPNAKKPSLLMRLFSTERKSSVYVMPATVAAIQDADVDGGDGAAARQHQRQMKRLQSVDSATMQRDREAMLKERRKQNRLLQQQQQRDGNVATSPPASAAQHNSVSTRHSIDMTGQSAIPVRPNSAVEVRTGSGTGAGRTKLSAQTGLKVHLNPKDSTQIAPNASSPTDKATRSPTGNGRSLPSSPAVICGEAPSTQRVSPGSSPVKQQQQQQQPSQRSQHPLGTTVSKSGAKKSPEAETSRPALSPTAPPIQPEDGNNSPVKHEATSTKRPSISVGNSAPPVGESQRKAKSGSSKSRNGNRKLKHRKKRAPQQSGEIKVDTSKPLEFPTTPDIISEYHRQKPFLNHNEEWLIVELLEYECLIDGIEIIRTVAKHSKFFEVEPDELWEEFFEFVENVPSYDEIINYDVWQEFLLEKYNC